MNEATSGAVAGTPSWRAQANLHTESIGSRQVVLAYTAPDENACTLRVSTAPNVLTLIQDVDPGIGAERPMDSRPGNLTDGLQRSFVIGNNDALTPDTLYYYKLSCHARVMPGTFRTTAASASNENWPVNLSPPASLGVAYATLEYGPTSTLASSTTVACSAQCLLMVPAVTAAVVYWRYVYLDSSHATIRASAVRVIAFP